MLALAKVTEGGARAYTGRGIAGGGERRKGAGGRRVEARAMWPMRGGRDAMSSRVLGSVAHTWCEHSWQTSFVMDTCGLADPYLKQKYLFSPSLQQTVTSRKWDKAGQKVKPRRAPLRLTENGHRHFLKNPN